MTSEKNSRAEEQAKAQYDSVCEMVAALECDYNRLEELRSERQGPGGREGRGRSGR
jgi:hypothetical protein